jgi:NADPH-dependent 7-cyano-7-deazaguanine reductase QueF
LYFSQNIIRIIKPRRIRLAVHAAGTEKRGIHIGFWWESQKEVDH